MRKSTSFMFEIDTRTFEYKSTASLKVVGHIWISYGDDAFPAPGWDDFPVRLMGSWVNRFLDVLSGKQKFCELFFMDGPYRVILDPVDLSASFVANGKRKEVVRIDSFDEVFASCVARAREIVRFGSTQGWQDRDFIHLRDTIDSLPNPGN